MDEYSQALRDGIVASLPGWVDRRVTFLVAAWRGPLDPIERQQVVDAGRRAAATVGSQLDALFSLDIDEQRTTPMSLVRAAVSYPTAVLRSIGVPEVERDEFAERAFPDDVYLLSPASWRDVDESLHDPGLAWGAWKAHQHLTRRRPRQ